MSRQWDGWPTRSDTKVPQGTWSGGRQLLPGALFLKGPYRILSNLQTQPAKSKTRMSKTKLKPEASGNHLLKAASLDLPDDFELSEDFIRCFKELENTRRNIYITGEAGTGKTTLLKYFRQNTQKNVVVLAPTGIAAINCYGQTLHSFFKFPPKLIQKEHVSRVYNGQKIFSKLDMVIIDEASMMRADLLDGVDDALRYATPYFFSSKIFDAASFKRMDLEKIYRQNDA